MKFYLQNGIERGGSYERLFLDTEKHAGCEQLLIVEAATWKEAREKVATSDAL